MDCRTALEILEVVRPNSDDLNDRDLQAAVAYLNESPECQAQFDQHQALDREIGRSVREVAVPEGLQHRLLAAIEAETANPPEVRQNQPGAPEPAPETMPARQPPPLHRRTWFQLLAAAACVAVAVGIWMGMGTPQETVALEDLLQKTSLTTEKLAEFNGDFDPKLPSGGWWGGRVRVSDTPQGDWPDQSGRHAVAVYDFSFRDRAGRAIQGVLLVTQRGSVDTPPAGTSFQNTEVSDYLPGTTWAVAAWTEGDLVYVCLVPAEARESLKQALQVDIS